MEGALGRIEVVAVSNIDNDVVNKIVCRSDFLDIGNGIAGIVLQGTLCQRRVLLDEGRDINKFLNLDIQRLLNQLQRGLVGLDYFLCQGIVRED